HSATHLLHHALQKHLGSHAQQQGSKVDDDWLRFDFTNLSPIGADELSAIATDVKAYVAAAAPVDWQELPLADARKAGAMMLFGEKYPDPVRMVSMGPIETDAFSRELCGGTHLLNTREVIQFEILSEEGVSAGTRRVVALTGQKARDHAQKVEEAADKTAELLSVAAGDLVAGVTSLLDRQKALKKAIAGGGHGDPTPYKSTSTTAATYEQKKLALAECARLLSASLLDVPVRVAALQGEIKSLTEQLATREAAKPLSADILLEQAEETSGVTLVIAETPGATPDLMRKLIDSIRQKKQPSAVLLASAQGDKVTLIAGVTKDLQAKGFSAGKWIGPVAKAVGGGGGGRPDMAQAGGKDPEKLPEAFAVARATAGEMLG
ncbi:MAG: hypothetical protein KDA37_09830, partial [Planctomycetales bacterium]|nr:hypothetical protein [Planctomycetales bacterium]